MGECATGRLQTFALPHFHEALGIALVGEDLRGLRRLHLVFELIGARIQRHVVCGDHAGERVHGLDHALGAPPAPPRSRRDMRMKRKSNQRHRMVKRASNSRRWASTVVSRSSMSITSGVHVMPDCGSFRSCSSRVTRLVDQRRAFTTSMIFSMTMIHGGMRNRTMRGHPLHHPGRVATCA